MQAAQSENRIIMNIKSNSLSSPQQINANVDLGPLL